MNEYVKFASDIINKIISTQCQYINLKIKDGKNNVKPGLVRRAIDFPSLMLNLGFIPAFTFYLSKAGEHKNIYELYDYLKSENQNQVTNSNYMENSNLLCKEMDISESCGYTGYVSILILLLEKIGKLSLKDLSQHRPDETLAKLLNETEKNIGIREERIILAYLIELKKVMEALSNALQ
mgnify:FL=1